MSVSEFEQSRRLSQAESQTILRAEIPLKERFFRYFQHEITGWCPMSYWLLSCDELTCLALQEQMERLADTSLVAGERADATHHCLAGIARLSNEVKDAASYIPTYDQRIYAEVDEPALNLGMCVDNRPGYQSAPGQAIGNSCCRRATFEIQLQDEKEPCFYISF